MPTTELTEWEPSAPMKLDDLTRRALEAHFAARIRTRTDDLVEVTPGGQVGTMRIGNDVIVVKPKIPIDRALFMVAYAADPYTWQDDTATLGQVEDLVEGVAALFLRAVRRVLAQGLLRSYRWVERDAPYVKGRIDWRRQSHRYAPVPIALRHQVFDDDIPENQLLRAVVERLRQTGVMGPAVQDLTRVWRRVSHVRSLSDPLAILNALTWTRHNAHYRPIMAIGRLILENSMLDVAAGDVAVEGFTLDMSSVFERFVRRALREATKLSERDFPDDWKGRGLALAESGAVRLLPDLGIRIGDEWRFVGDVKYKRDYGPGRHADLYQVLAYAVATGLPDATLIYALGPAEPSRHVVRHLGVRLHLRHLDLSKSPHDVLRSVFALAPGRHGEGWATSPAASSNTS